MNCPNIYKKYFIEKGDERLSLCRLLTENSIPNPVFIPGFLFGTGIRVLVNDNKHIAHQELYDKGIGKDGEIR